MALRHALVLGPEGPSLAPNLTILVRILRSHDRVQGFRFKHLRCEHNMHKYRKEEPPPYRLARIEVPFFCLLGVPGAALSLLERHIGSVHCN